MIILLDAMGGDNAPDANIKGAVAAINQIKAELWLIGKEEVIKAKLKEFYNKTAEEISSKYFFTWIVSVKELDKENKRFKLSYEKKGPNPWNKVEEKYHVGDVVKVKISKIMPFGAFAELEKGIEGLIHISQICERKIAKPEEELQVGQKVNAKIINIDFENKKIELSIRELEGTSQEYKENA